MSNEYKDWVADNEAEEKVAENGFTSPVVANYNGPIDSFIRYYIDEEKKVITAVYEDCRFDAMKIVEAKFKNVRFSFFRDEVPLMKKTYRGKAVCHKDDLWDEEVGMKVAREKCLYKYRRDMTDSIATFLEKFTSGIKKLENFEAVLIKKLLDYEEGDNNVF